MLDLGMIGVDEVGRGAWAGPVCVAAVQLPADKSHSIIRLLKDSKKLSPKSRAELSQIIKQQAIVGIGWANSNEIDNIGLNPALGKAMGRALKLFNSKAKIILDGNVNYLPKITTVRTIIKADQLIPEVMAASIVAKVARDSYMRMMALRYENYGFAKHVGYGTSLHRMMLMDHGPTAIHRLSFTPVRQVAMMHR